MFKIHNENGTIEVSETAVKGLLTQFVEGKEIEHVKFLGFKKVVSGIEGLTKGLGKVFGSDKGKKEEVEENHKLVFHLDFQVTKLHPLHKKGAEIQELIYECVEHSLGVSRSEVEVHVYFSKYQEASEE